MKEECIYMIKIPLFFSWIKTTDDVGKLVIQLQNCLGNVWVSVLSYVVLFFSLLYET